jgi:hypothetical protein
MFAQVAIENPLKRNRVITSIYNIIWVSCLVEVDRSLYVELLSNPFFFFFLLLSNPFFLKKEKEKRIAISKPKKIQLNIW